VSDSIRSLLGNTKNFRTCSFLSSWHESVAKCCVPEAALVRDLKRCRERFEEGPRKLADLLWAPTQLWRFIRNQTNDQLKG
jgi:hypothetical protein